MEIQHFRSQHLRHCKLHMGTFLGINLYLQGKGSGLLFFRIGKKGDPQGTVFLRMKEIAVKTSIRREIYDHRRSRHISFPGSDDGCGAVFSQLIHIRPHTGFNLSKNVLLCLIFFPENVSLRDLLLPERLYAGKNGLVHFQPVQVLAGSRFTVISIICSFPGI